MIARTSAKSRLIETGDRHDVDDRAHGPGKHFVHDRECLEHRGFLADQVDDALVLDDQQRVDVRLELDPGRVGNFSPTNTFEFKWPRHDADRERAGLSCLCRDHRRGPRTRPATEAGCDEDQVGPGHHPADLLGILFGSLPPDGGVATGPETLRQLRADLDASHGERVLEHLGVGVDGDVVHAALLGPDHVVHGIAACSADTDHANGALARMASRFPVPRQQDDDQPADEHDEQNGGDQVRPILGEPVHEKPESTGDVTSGPWVAAGCRLRGGARMHLCCGGRRLAGSCSALRSCS